MGQQQSSMPALGGPPITAPAQTAPTQTAPAQTAPAPAPKKDEPVSTVNKCLESCKESCNQKKEPFENVIFNNNVICTITIAVILVVLYLKFVKKNN